MWNCRNDAGWCFTHGHLVGIIPDTDASLQIPICELVNWIGIIFPQCLSQAMQAITVWSGNLFHRLISTLHGDTCTKFTNCHWNTLYKERTHIDDYTRVSQVSLTAATSQFCGKHPHFSINTDLTQVITWSRTHALASVISHMEVLHSYSHAFCSNTGCQA